MNKYTIFISASSANKAVEKHMTKNENDTCWISPVVCVNPDMTVDKGFRVRIHTHEGLNYYL